MVMIKTFTLPDSILGLHFRQLGFFFFLSNYLGTTSMDWIFGSCAGFWFSLYSHSYTSWYSLAHRNTKMELEHLEMWGQWRAWALLTFPLATDFALHVSFYLLQIR